MTVSLFLYGYLMRLFKRQIINGSMPEQMKHSQVSRRTTYVVFFIDHCNEMDFRHFN
jgi:hypothetical protein